VLIQVLLPPAAQHVLAARRPSRRGAHDRAPKRCPCLEVHCQVYQTKLEQMIVYAQTALCRTHVLLEALGETVESSQCGTRDNCRGLAMRSEAVAAGAA